MAFEGTDTGAAGGNPVNIDQQIQYANTALGPNSPYNYSYDSPGMQVAQTPNPNYNPNYGPGGVPTGPGYGASTAMTQYEAAQVADAKAKLQEQQREFDAKQAQDMAIFNAQQHTEEEKLQFAQLQEQNKVKFQYAQLAQAQQQFEQNLGWDKTKFYTSFGLDVTKEQDQAVQQYRDALMKEQGSPQDMVSYLYNIRGYTAPAGGTSQQMPLPPSVLAAMQAQGIPIPGSQQGGNNGPQQPQYPFLGNMPYGFGGGAGNMASAPGIPKGSNQVTGQQTPPPPSAPLGIPSGGNMLGSLVQFGQQAAGQQLPSNQPVTMPINSGAQQQQSGGQNQPFNVWQYLPPQLQGFFTPNSLIGNTGGSAPSIPGTSAQPQAITPSAQMFNQLTPSEQGALQSFQSQQLGIMPQDMKTMMDQTAPISNQVLTPGTFQ